MTDFQNSFTVRLSSKFLAMLLQNSLSHLKSIATLPCEILMSEKQIPWNMHYDLRYFAR